MIVNGRPAALLALVLALSAVPGARARETAADFANQAPIPADGAAALYRFALTAEVYRGCAEADLADVRVFNGAGEALPFAWYPPPAGQSQAAAAVALKVFALPGAALPVAAGSAGVHVETDTAGAVVRIDVGRGAPPAPADGAAAQPTAYLLDASAVHVPIRALVLDVAAGGDYSGRVRLEASSDLAAWRTVLADATLLAITRGAERLERRRIEFAPQSAPYYRLVWNGMPQGTRLDAVTAQPGDLHREPERQWAELPALAGDKPGEYRFDAGAHFPADRLRLALPEANTVVPVDVYSRARTDEPWRLVGHETFYRLNRAEGEVASPPLAVTAGGDRYWRVMVDERGGGLGAGMPRLELGWVPQELAFAARGAPPYVLAFGRSQAAPAAIGIAALVPGYRGGDETPAAAPADSASGPAVQPVRVVLGPPLRPVVQPAGPGAAAFGAKTLALWSALLAGVGLLGAMAWRLQRQMKKAP